MRPSSPLDEYRALLQAHPQLTAHGGVGSIELLTADGDINAAQTAARDRLIAKGRPESWATVGMVFEDQYVYVLRDAVRFPPASPGGPQVLGTYIRVITKPVERSGVAILCVYDGKIVLQEHFRHATRSWRLEIPRGFVDPGETCEQAARRELGEEMKAEVASLVPMGDYHPNTGLSTELCMLHFATLSKIGALETPEGIRRLRFLSEADFRSLIRDNTVTDGFSLAAYARATVLGHLPGSSVPGQR